jgi:hypothetical protein
MAVHKGGKIRKDWALADGFRKGYADAKRN